MEIQFRNRASKLFLTKVKTPNHLRHYVHQRLLGFGGTIKSFENYKIVSIVNERTALLSHRRVNHINSLPLSQNLFELTKSKDLYKAKLFTLPYQIGYTILSSAKTKLQIGWNYFKKHFLPTSWEPIYTGEARLRACSLPNLDRTIYTSVSDTDSLCVLTSFLWVDRDEALKPKIKASQSAYEHYVKATDNLFADEKLQKYDSMTLGKLKIEFNAQKSVSLINKTFFSLVSCTAYSVF